jgi:hypothetical protein
MFLNDYCQLVWAIGAGFDQSPWTYAHCLDTEKPASPYGLDWNNLQNLALGIPC